MFKLYDKIRYEYFGIFGVLFISACCVITSIGFVGYAHEGYSFLNHAISELGMWTESPWSWVFNMGFIIGFPVILIFILGIRTVLPSKLTIVGILFGIVTVIGAVFVGIFPADVNIIGHGIAALTAFSGAAVTVTIISIAIARQKDVRISRWLCILGAAVAVCFSVLVIMLFTVKIGASSIVNLKAAMAASRPSPFWIFAFIEWLPLIEVFLWIFLASIDSLRRNKQK